MHGCWWTRSFPKRLNLVNPAHSEVSCRVGRKPGARNSTHCLLSQLLTTASRTVRIPCKNVAKFSCSCSVLKARSCEKHLETSYGMLHDTKTGCQGSRSQLRWHLLHSSLKQLYRAQRTSRVMRTSCSFVLSIPVWKTSFVQNEHFKPPANFLQPIHYNLLRTCSASCPGFTSCERITQNSCLLGSSFIAN